MTSKIIFATSEMQKRIPIAMAAAMAWSLFVMGIGIGIDSVVAPE